MDGIKHLFGTGSALRLRRMVVFNRPFDTSTMLSAGKLRVTNVDSRYPPALAQA